MTAADTPDETGPSPGSAASGPGAADGAEPLPAGTRVEVHNGFDGSWTRGFTVIDVVDGTYRLVRRTDGSELPRTFPPDQVRRERKRSTWWV